MRMTAFSCTLHKIISEFVRIPMTLEGHFVMPANLPPEYQKAEAVFRAASTHQEKIEALQVEGKSGSERRPSSGSITRFFGTSITDSPYTQTGYYRGGTLERKP